MIDQLKTTGRVLHKYNYAAMLPVVRFVGMRNKPGMKPLDSKTMSGNIIDAIISELPFHCSKTNLCETDYLPADFLEIEEAGIVWHQKYEPKDNDIIVLLGGWVHANFWPDRFRTVKLKHPPTRFGNINKGDYIADAVEQIMKVACSHYL